MLMAFLAGVRAPGMAVPIALVSLSKSQFTQWPQNGPRLSGPMLEPVLICPMLARQSIQDKQDTEMDNPLIASKATVFFNIPPASAFPVLRVFISSFVPNDYRTLPCFVSV